MPAPPLRVVERGSPEYPASVAHLDEPPARLWVIGRDLALLPPCVAVVGARRATAYGLDVTRMLAADFAAAGLCVVSGMARGIDQMAHEGALSVPGAATVAVLGTGADVPYPADNRRLYERIAERGAIVSQFPPGTPPHKRNFPERNVIVAALALGVVVVQGASAKSGALITARAAAALGRQVFAVPGDIRAKASTVPHALIRDGASICTGLGEVVRELQLDLERSLALADEPPPPGLSADEEAVLLAVSEEPGRPDLIAARTGLDAATVGRTLTDLEIAGLICRTPDGGFMRRRVLADALAEARGSLIPGLREARSPA